MAQAGESSGAAEHGADMRIASLMTSSDPRQALATAIEIIEERGREIVQLREELLAERGKVAETFRNSARRAAQIAILEGKIANGKKREDQLEHELEKRDRMMDQVLNYRDKECASELSELRHENADLSSKVRQRGAARLALRHRPHASSTTTTLALPHSRPDGAVEGACADAAAGAVGLCAEVEGARQICK